MSNALLPTLLIGLGPFGNYVLDCLVEQLQEAYGVLTLPRLALLGFDVLAPAEARTAVRRYSLQRDLGRWADDPAVWADYVGWQDGDPSPVPSSSAATTLNLRFQDQRLLRLTMLKHLEDNAAALEHVMVNSIEAVQQQLPAGAASGSPSVPVYLLGALHEPVVGATILDIANLARHAMQQARLEKVRVVLHLALPAALVEPRHAHLATWNQRAYTTLRQIARFSRKRPEQAVRDPLYPPSSPLSRYNRDDDVLIDIVWLYSQGADGQPMTREQLAAQWVDSLLAQLDADFGKAFRQHEIENISNAQQAAYRRSGSDWVVGTQFTRSAVFPRRRLQQAWQQRLAYEALDRWLAAEHDLARRWQTLTTWATDRSGALRPRPPGIVAACLPCAQVAGSELVASGTIWKPERLFNAVTDYGTMPQYGEVERQWRWQPGAGEPPLAYDAGNVAALCTPLEEQIISDWGDPDAAAEAREGRFQQLVSAFREAQIEQYAASLQAFVMHHLHTSYPANTLAMVRDLSQAFALAQDKFAQAQDEAARQRQLLPARLRTARPTQLWERSLRGRRASKQVKYYLSVADELVTWLRQETLFANLAALAAALRAITQQVVAQLAAWQALLAAGPDSLRGQLAPPLPAAQVIAADDTGRLQLIDPAWFEQQYLAHAADWQRRLLATVQWQLWGDKPLSQGSLYVTLAPPSPAAGEPVVLAAGAGTGTARCEPQVWRDQALQIVKASTASLTLWDYLSAEHPTANHASLTRAHLAGGAFALRHQAWQPDTTRERHFLIRPQATDQRPEDNVFVAGVLQALKQRVNGIDRPDILGQDTQLTHFAYLDMLPIEAVEAYQVAANAYNARPVAARAQLYSLPGEAHAARLEAQLSTDYAKLLREHRVSVDLDRLRLHPSIVGALGNPAITRLFVWVDAFGLIKKVDYPVMMQLSIAGQPCWLSNDSAEDNYRADPLYDDLVEVFRRFCCDKPFRPATGRAVLSIDYPAVEAEIERAIIAEVEAGELPALPAGSNLESWLHSLAESRYHADAARARVELGRLYAYRQRQLDALAQPPSTPARRDLQLVLALLSDQLFNEGERQARKLVRQLRR